MSCNRERWSNVQSSRWMPRKSGMKMKQNVAKRKLCRMFKNVNYKVNNNSIKTIECFTLYWLNLSACIRFKNGNWNWELPKRLGIRLTFRSASDRGKTSRRMCSKNALPISKESRCWAIYQQLHTLSVLMWFVRTFYFFFVARLNTFWSAY